jgi:hypothetical protein
MKNIAFYYPGHIWHDTDWIKNMLLFFDGVGFVIPEYKKGEPELLDPVLAGPLQDLGLLHYFVADEVIDDTTTQKLYDSITAFLESGALESLDSNKTEFHSLSMSRMGYFGNAELAVNLFEKLKELGLARDTEDGSSIPMHPIVRYLILVLLAQLLREPGLEKGFDIAPITDRQNILRSLTEVLNLPTNAAAGRVVEFDLQAVSADLSAVPLDEVLDFRNQYADQHRLYMRGLRKFSREVSLLPEHDQKQAVLDRQAELDDYAADLKKASRRVWQSPAIIGLGLAGAAWTATNDPMSALLAAGGLAIDAAQRSNQEIDAFSYLFSARNRYY